MIGNRGDAAKQRIGVTLAHLFLDDEAAQRLRDPCLARFGARKVDVGQQHIMAGSRRHLRNAGAHLSRSDNADDHMLPFR